MTTSVSIRLLPGLGEDMVPPRPAAPPGRSLALPPLSCQDPFGAGGGEKEGGRLERWWRGGPRPALRLRGGLPLAAAAPPFPSRLFLPRGLPPLLSLLLLLPRLFLLLLLLLLPQPPGPPPLPAPSRSRIAPLLLRSLPPKLLLWTPDVTHSDLTAQASPYWAAGAVTPAASRRRARPLALPPLPREARREL